MISFFEASLQSLSIHRVGNKIYDESNLLSKVPVKLSDDVKPWLMECLLAPFQKVNEQYSFYHPSGDLYLNEAWRGVNESFQGNPYTHTGSIRLAYHLYEVSNHPKIRSGELCVAYFKNVQIEGELLDAIGIFKSENKHSYLHINNADGAFHLSVSEGGINLQGFDKGCLIFNTNADAGFKIVCLQEKDKLASYWRDEFLGLKVINNSYHQTNSMIGIVKSFITDKLDDEFEISTADKVDLLNKSVKYLKDKESFDLEEFSQEVLSSESAIQSFKNYKANYEDEFDQAIPESFDLSSAAVKKSLSSLKRTIKLDRNFQLQVHGDRNLIEKGFDSDKALNYYKVYFKEEA